MVRSFDEKGREIPDDGSWHRRVSESEFVLAGFLQKKELIAADVAVTRREDLVIRFSQLTPLGQAFIKSGAIDRWMGSLDRARKAAPLTDEGLERRWKRFLEGYNSQGNKVQ